MKRKFIGLFAIFLFFFVQTACSQTIGRVVMARAKGVVISLGQNAGVQKGDVFSVYRDSLDSGKLRRTRIARVQVVKAFSKISVARIAWLKPDRHIRKGDVAIRTPSSFWSDYFSSGNFQTKLLIGMNKLYPTDLNRALVQQGSVYGVNAKNARINTGSAFGVQVRARLPFHLCVVWDGNLLSTASLLQKNNSLGVNVKMNWALKTWSSTLGLAVNFLETRIFDLYAGARAGILIADIKFLNTYGQTYDNAYFEETNLASGLFGGISYKPNRHVVLTIETGYNARGLGNLQGYHYTPGGKRNHYIPRTAISGNRIHVDLSGFSILLGAGIQM